MIINKIESIAPGNLSVEFVAKRIQDENYRGLISSQQNRYTLDQLIIILTKLDKYAPDGSLLRIRTTDLSKRPQNLPEEVDYAKMCDEIKREAGIGTQDALRKNLFVDFHRMGLIDRYSKYQVSIGPYTKKGVYYVSLSKLGEELITAPPQQQYFIYSSAVNNFLPGYIDTILELLRSNSGINQISP